MRRRFAFASFLALTACLFTGCPKRQGNAEFKAGKQAELIQDYDSALIHYERALRSDPTNSEYKLRATQMRFQAGQFHVEQGKKALAKGDLQLAYAEFQKAEAIDPSNDAAGQEAKRTMELIAAQRAAEAPPAPARPQDEAELLAKPPELKPLSREPINLKMTNEARIVFDTVAKLAGLTVIFDPDFQSRRISIELPNVTLEQALDAVAIESKAFWKPVTSNIILVAPDQPQKRRDFEDQVVRTFYLSNTLTPQDLTEIVTGLRQLLDLKRVQQVNSQNAIVIRDTPDKLILASKIIRDIDKAKPEVFIQVQVLEASLNRVRDLGIQPGQSAVVTFTPRAALQPNTSSSSSSSSSTTTTTTTPQITLNNLKRLSTADYSITLPGAAAMALLTDSTTRIIQNPEIRVTDGQTAKVRIGDRVPVATGSFQAGVGVGVGGGAGVINPLVNTQFQYIDVGVSIDVTPRVHPDAEISMKLNVEVSTVTNTVSIGGINQPVISQRKIEHDIRLKEGEASILGGLIQRTDMKALNGWPGLASIPFLHYFFADDRREVQDDEVLIVLTPHIIRLPSISAENLQTLAAGTDTNVRVYREETGVPAPAPAKPGSVPPPSPQVPMDGGLRFEPATVELKKGDTATVALVADNVKDLFSIPLLIQYDPAVIQIDDVRNGGFLSGGTQEIAIVQRVDQQRGQAIVSATRQPNTPGVNGSGTLLGIVVRAIAPGTSKLQIIQMNARDSQQKPIPLTSKEATITVQ